MSISHRNGAKGLERFLSSKIVHYYFSKVGIFLAPQLHSMGDFFVRNSISNNFCLKLFLMRCVFLAASRSKLNLLPHFCTLLFFKDVYLSSPLAPLQREIDISARGLFRTKFNFEQFLFKAFFDAMRIFGDVEPFSPYFDLICLDNSPNTPFQTKHQAWART